MQLVHRQFNQIWLGTIIHKVLLFLSIESCLLNWIHSESLSNNPFEPEQHRTSGPTDLYHRAAVLNSSQIQMEWKTLHTVGCGLSNTDELGACRNVCYINAVIQCLAVTAPFVQWLCSEAVATACKYNGCPVFFLCLSRFIRIATKLIWSCSIIISDL